MLSHPVGDENNIVLEDMEVLLIFVDRFENEYI